MQLHKAVVEAVLALDEPFRSAVVWRHLDGLSAEEIARRQGCTAELARQRVSRGLAGMRKQIARLHGHDPRGIFALGVLLTRASAAGLGTGGIVMGAKVAAGIAGAALVAAGLWLGAQRESGHGESARAAAEASAAELAPPVQPVATAAPEPPAPAADQRTEPQRTAEALRPVPCRLAGRLTDTRGGGLSEASLELLLPPSAMLLLGPKALPLEVVQALERVRAVPLASAADGAVSVDLPAEMLGRSILVRASCAGFVARQAEVEPDRPFALALAALPAFEGRVLDRAGSPVAPPGSVRFDVLDATTGKRRVQKFELAPEGCYRAPGLPLGRLVHVEASALGFSLTEWARDQQLEPDGTSTFDLVLDPGALITGTVLDARTDEPIPQALVWTEGFEPDEGSPQATTDSRGRFSLAGASEHLVHQEEGRRIALFQLRAQAEGYIGSPTRGYASTASEEHAYDFEMRLEPAGCALELHLTLADGSPARAAKVWCIDSQGNPHWESAGGDGVGRIGALPAGTLGLWIECRARKGPGPDATIAAGFVRTLTERADGGALFGYFEREGSLHALRVELELVHGETRRVELVLAPPPDAGFEGRVVDAQGRGVPGLTVRSHLNFEMNNLAIAEGEDEVVTDADGRYRLSGQHAGKYEVWVDAEEAEWACALPEHAYVQVGAQGSSTVEDIVVGRCLTLEGRVDPGEHDPTALRLVARELHSERERAHAELEADGSFRFEPLVGQEYELVLLSGERELDRASAGPERAAGIFLRAR
jgi:hypothetical protein